MTAVVIRWHDRNNVELLVDGVQVLSVSDLDENGGRDGEASVAYAAEVTAGAVARALGASVTIERKP
ncbi:hypothetical protein GCM10010172_07390 [Paractinoplanes ferrugineus]|uniref:Uncharacterized protein n=1 Tax=Paractinoplanes ferrugineus TaxID=113564 RepID=A0A919JBG8_9ACTN|nr:hypothetical protein [Actinoplanes ferrugineus]GIE16782.1 hypothetical protein Afe05nite_86220 [Actinoplanes ferrugineus]